MADQETTIQIVDDLITFCQENARKAFEQSSRATDYQTECIERAETLLAFKKSLLEEETLDLVEVTRCKNCAFWRRNPANSVYGDCGKPVTKENDYCSYGRRKGSE